MIRALALFTLLASSFTQASGMVDYLEVDNNVVLFSTTETKAHAALSCVTDDNADLWSVSLATDSGRAMYSLILTAMAKGDELGLSVSTANDCGVITGIERADNVALALVVAEETAASESTAADNSPFSGTIFDNFMQLKFNALQNRNGVGLNGTDYFTGLEDETGSVYTGVLGTNDRKQLVSHSGSGWVTSVILPLASKNSDVLMELVIDGETYEFRGSPQDTSGRFVLGGFSSYSSDLTTFRNVLASPEEVVWQGKGNPFNEGFELWVTMSSFSTTSTYEYWGVQYLNGHPH